MSRLFISLRHEKSLSLQNAPDGGPDTYRRPCIRSGRLAAHPPASRQPARKDRRLCRHTLFGGCFAAGLLVLRRLAQNSEALTLTPEKLTVRQPNGREYALKWHEIRSFREADINGQPFIAVITSEPQKPAAQRHNRLRLWLRRLDERLTGSAINISPSSIHCRRDELYETLCEYLEKYGR